MDSLSRKPQCPVTCRHGVIRPPRGGAPSCGTRHLRSGRSVLAKQVDYQTSFLLSSADGSHELSRAPPRCGMALASLSSHHRLCSRCGRINLPIVLIGATRPPLWAATIGLLLVDDFQRIARGRHRDGSCQHSRILHDHRYGAHAVPARRFVLHVCHEEVAQQLMILNAPPLPGAPSASRPRRTRL